MKFLTGYLLIITVAFFLLPSCGNLKDPDFKNFENLRSVRPGLKETRLLVDLHYFNPNKTRLKLRLAEGDAWLDDNYLGRFRVDTVIHIMPLSDFILPVELKMDMAHFLQNSALLLRAKEVNVKVNGTARVGKGLIYINYPIRYEGKQNLDSLMNVK